MNRYLQFGDSFGNPYQAERLILGIDASPSMDDDDWPPTRLGAAVEAAEALVQIKLDRYPNDQIGVESFAFRAKMEHPLESAQRSHHSIRHALRQIKTGSSTNIAACITAAGKLLDGNQASSNNLGNWISRLVFEDAPTATPASSPPTTCDRLIILTDGHHNVGSKRRVTAAAADLKQRGVCIDVIGIGGSPSAVQEDLLREVASTNPADGSARYCFIGDKGELIRKFKSLAHHVKRA